MATILYSIIVLLLSVNFLLSLPKVVSIAQTKTISHNIPNNKIGEAIAAPITQKLIPKSQNITPPLVSAAAVLVVDIESDYVLFAKDPNKRVPIASTTKIMSALVASDYFKPNDTLTVLDLSGISGSTMGLKIGERLSFRSLLYGMLLNSGNDAAFTIAQNFPGGVKTFVAEMNKKASGLELINTHFDNPAGFDSLNHYSSAADLAKIAKTSQEDPQLARIFATKETIVASEDKVFVHQLYNLNKLLGMQGVLGIKTGLTPQARENLVGLIERDGHRILTVLLGSDDRFGETKALMEWAFENFRWE